MRQRIGTFHTTESVGWPIILRPVYRRQRFQVAPLPVSAKDDSRIMVLEISPAQLAGLERLARAAVFKDLQSSRSLLAPHTPRE
jgi:hypothetical protein